MGSFQSTSQGKGALNAVIGFFLFIGVVGFFWFAFAKLQYDWQWHTAWDYRRVLLQGWGLTALVSFVALIFSVVTGFLLVFGQRSGIGVLRIFCRAYVEIIRGTPLLVHILIFYWVAAPVFGVNSKFWVGILALTAFSSAYLSEILRGGIDSIARTQIDAARAVGFTSVQIYRYVIIPQAMRRVLPGVAGELVNLIKNSSLLMVIGLTEYTKATYDFFSSSYRGFEGFLLMIPGYLLLTLPVTYLTYYLEKKFRYES